MQAGTFSLRALHVPFGLSEDTCFAMGVVVDCVCVCARARARTTPKSHIVQWATAQHFCVFYRAEGKRVGGGRGC